MSTYSIKDLERLSGIKAHTLRIWEQRYHILAPARTGTNIRLYSDADLKKVLNISLLNSRGFRISAIADFSEQQLLDEVNRLLLANGNPGQQVDTLVFCLLYMDEERFEKTLSSAILQFGFEQTVESVIFPFLRQLGDMWQVGLVTPAQEHYISNLIRQKLIVGVDGVKPSKAIDPRTFLFFLPEGELHELGLIYLHYLAKKAGHKCYYLGQSVPTEDLLNIAASLRPDFLVAILTSTPVAGEFEHLLDQCGQKLPGSRLLLSGRYVFHGDLAQTVPPVNVFKDFADFRHLLNLHNGLST